MIFPNLIWTIFIKPNVKGAKGVTKNIAMAKCLTPFHYLS